eukprot:3932213-Rhodomonas_salina.1
MDVVPGGLQPQATPSRKATLQCSHPWLHDLCGVLAHFVYHNQYQSPSLVQIGVANSYGVCGHLVQKKRTWILGRSRVGGTAWKPLFLGPNQGGGSVE